MTSNVWPTDVTFLVSNEQLFDFLVQACKCGYKCSCETFEMRLKIAGRVLTWKSEKLIFKIFL